MGKSKRAQQPQSAQPSQVMVTFAIRMPLALREAIHAVSGRQQATAFVRKVLEAAVQKAPKPTR